MNTIKRGMMVAAIPLATLVLASCRTGQAVPARKEIATATDVIAAMHDKYASTWYQTLRFRQKVIRAPAADGTLRPEEVWLEHAEIPGKLRIDLGTQYNGRGNIYSGDSVFVFNPPNPPRRVKQRNALMVLGFDVYRQDVERSLAVLREENFDMTRFRVDTWQGRPVYVVGADAGDLHTKQFWIDQERLVFVRLLNPSGPPGSTRTAEARFDRYVPFGGTWISPYVVFLTDGKETMREEYFDMEANPKLPVGLFDPDQWTTVKPN
ncbi:MAG: hypothetical protein ABIS27_00355 [Longimicrobiales bacterium]